MKLIVGLGNFGIEYAQTRHNIGFMTADLIAEKLNITFSKEKFHAMVAESNVNGEKIILMKPLTYMNKSGLAVAEAMNFFKLDLSDVLVIYDDMDMSCGQVRIRKKGSGGGHRGMGDIIQCLGSDMISRVKVGIDHPVHGTVVDFVLKPFSDEEWEKVGPALDVAAEAAIYWLENDIQETMNVYNGYGKEGAQKPKPVREQRKREKDFAVNEKVADAVIEKDVEKQKKFFEMLKNFFGDKTTKK